MQSKTTNIVHNLSQNFGRYLQHIKNSAVVHQTDVIYNRRLSDKYGCNIYFKREDLQSVRSFKIRGAYCKIMENLSLNENNDIKHPSNPPIVVTASAGNHAQGV
eukprot:330408_1